MARAIARDTLARASMRRRFGYAAAARRLASAHGMSPPTNKDTDTRHTHQYQDNGADTSAR